MNNFVKSFILFTIRVLNKNKLTRRGNKILETGWLINNKHLFLTVLEAGKSKNMVPADSVSGGDLRPHRPPFSPSNFAGWKGQGSSLGSFYRDTNPIHEGSALMT